MILIQGIILIIIFSCLLILYANPKWKGLFTIGSVLILSVVTGIIALRSLFGHSVALILKGSLVTGDIPMVIDPLSAWFILVINFTFITGVIYGARYMEAYSDNVNGLSLHWISYILAHVSLLSVTVLQNSLVFLISWEIMALSTFILVIFEGHKAKTIKAGINYLIQSHVAILFLTIAFIRVYSTGNSLSFDAIHHFAGTQPAGNSFMLMCLFFIGFGFKAGFVPLHTWLPHAHPAAPSHISGMMSGVLIKIGIYGILRMLLLIDVNYTSIGYLILIVSVITGLYGVMLAIVQHNLKRLLAYHSVENIGIIGIGIGLGCIGSGEGNNLLAYLGFAGALLHTLNHSLFKSLLFYSAGNVYQATHTMNIERFGGLIRRMPQTALLFLVAALAICGLPPFNGFVSEFIIYLGLFNGINHIAFPAIIAIVSGIFGLSLIGGLAIFCFTKAFGSVFLGIPRHIHESVPREGSLQKLIPMYMIVILIVAIGVFPQVFIRALASPVAQFTSITPQANLSEGVIGFEWINKIGYYSLAFILLAGTIYLLRRWLTRSLPQEYGPTWGCGYIAPTSRMQYTASSFVRNYRKLAGPLLTFHKEKKEVTGIFPGEAAHLTHPQDKTEEYLIKMPIGYYKALLEKFSFLQNGKLQFYLLYGMLFILLLVAIPLIINFFK